MKRIVLLDFKRTSDSAEAYYHDMRKVTEKQHIPILTGLKALAVDRNWEVEVVPLVTGQRKGVANYPPRITDPKSDW